VHPIPGYGAIEIGAHRFYEKKAGKDDVAIRALVMAEKVLTCLRGNKPGAPVKRQATTVA
jgi:hypothetical protein